MSSIRLETDAAGARKMFEELDLDPKKDCIPPLRMSEDGSVSTLTHRTSTPVEMNEDANTSQYSIELITHVETLKDLLMHNQLMSEPVLEMMGKVCGDPDVSRTHADLMMKYQAISSSSASESMTRAELRFHANLGPMSFISNLSGLYLGCIGASGSKHIEQVKMISQILDHQAAREAKTNENMMSLMREMERITAQINNSSHVTSQLVASADKIEIFVNELQTHPLIPKDVDCPSIPSRSRGPARSAIQEVAGDGIYVHGYAAITIRGESIYIEANGIEGDIIQRVLFSRLKMKAKKVLMNLDLEKLVSLLDAAPNLIKMMDSSERDDRYEAVTRVMNLIPRSEFQWSQ